MQTNTRTHVKCVIGLLVQLIVPTTALTDERQ